MQASKQNTLGNMTIGEIVFNAWKTLYLREKTPGKNYFDKNEIVKALCLGRLPQWYEDNIRKLHATGSGSGYTQKLIENNSFSQIPWDHHIHSQIAKMYCAGYKTK